MNRTLFSSWNFSVPLFITILFLELVSSQAVDHLSELEMPNDPQKCSSLCISGRSREYGDDSRIHQIVSRAFHNGPLSTREKRVIGVSAGLAGLFVISSILIIIGYQQQWHRSIAAIITCKDHRRTPRRTVPEDTFQRHHESMFSVGTPRVSYNSEAALYHTGPHQPGLPSPATSYYQPIEVYRSLMQNKETLQPPMPLTPAILAPVRHPAHQHSSPQAHRCESYPPALSDCEISPRTIPAPTRRVIHAPQPRRIGLPRNPRHVLGLGIAIPPPPPLVKLRPLPLREYDEK